MIDENNLGGFAIDIFIFNFIREHIPEGSTIFELGSGTGTIELCKFYTVYSVEHNPKWMNKSKSNYIYAPIVRNWYAPEKVKAGRPEKYDLLLIDGPPGGLRTGFQQHLDLFDLSVKMIFDDLHREPDLAQYMNVCKKLGQGPNILGEVSKKTAPFGLINF